MKLFRIFFVALLLATTLPIQAEIEYIELDDGTIISYDLDAIDGGVDIGPYTRIKDRSYHWVFRKFWYEDGYRQGVYGDGKNITDIKYGKERGREIYDPDSDAWYWLDAIFEGAKATDKEVWMPYVYQDEQNGSTDGKWVRYNSAGHMIKGWYTVSSKDCDIYPSQAGNTYFYDHKTGAMAKGYRWIDGKQYHFHETNGRLLQDKSYNIDVQMNLQETGYYCGPATVQAVLSYHGIYFTQANLALQLNTSNKTGTEYADVARVVNKHVFNNAYPGQGEPGYRAVIWTTGSAGYSARELFEARVIRDMETADPVFVAINLKTVYPALPKANHLVLVTGCTMDQITGRILSYVIDDPYGGSQPYTENGRKKIDADTLWNAINNNTEPGYIW